MVVSVWVCGGEAVVVVVVVILWWWVVCVWRGRGLGEEGVW